MADLSYDAPHGAMSFAFDAAQRRMTVVSRGEVDGPNLRRIYEQVLGARPEARTWDMLLDLLEDRRAATAADVAALADLFTPQGDDPRSPAHVAMVVSDPNFQLWARAMDFQFGGFRIHSVHATVAAAAAFLDSVADRPRD